MRVKIKLERKLFTVIVISFATDKELYRFVVDAKVESRVNHLYSALHEIASIYERAGNEVTIELV